MKYAVIEIGGKQMLVEEGKYYAINRLPHKAGSSLNINRILFCNDKGRRVVGHPYIENLESVQVKATILEHFKDKKIALDKRTSSIANTYNDR